MTFTTPLAACATRVSVSLLAALAIACAPSDFDGLVPRASDDDPSTACDGGEPTCAAVDGGDMGGSDASAPAPMGGAPGGGGSPAPRDASAVDATIGACGTTAACTPLAVETGSGACDNCNNGKRTRSHSCGADCRWGSWGPFSECEGARGCAPGDTQACDPVDTCGVRVCNAKCSWDDTCVPKPGAECVRRRVYFEGGKKIVQEEGSMYMCCGDGQWSFCQPDTCQWSDSCASCSPANCEC